MCVWYMLTLFYAVADAGATVKNLEQEADRLTDKLKPIKELEDNLRKNISEIKELINQARKQANSVSCFYFQYQELIVIWGIIARRNAFTQCILLNDLSFFLFNLKLFGEEVENGSLNFFFHKFLKTFLENSDHRSLF